MRLVAEQVGEGPHFRVDGSDLITRPQWAPVPYAPTSSVIVHAETDTSHALRQEMDHLSPVDITQADIPETWESACSPISLEVVRPPLVELVQPHRLFKFQVSLTRAKGGGVGIAYQLIKGHTGPFVVVHLIPGTPADLCNRIIPGDIIVAVNKVAVKSLSLDQTCSLIRGDAGTEVEITLVRRTCGRFTGGPAAYFSPKDLVDRFKDSRQMSLQRQNWPPKPTPPYPAPVPESNPWPSECHPRRSIVTASLDERRKVTETQQERFHRLLAEVNIIHKAEMTHVSELREMAGLGVVGLREDKGTRCQHER
jgi:hypothetical protein